MNWLSFTKINAKNMCSVFPYQLRVDGLLLEVVVARLEFLISHELDGSVRHPPQSGDKPLVEAAHALVSSDLVEGVQHPLVRPLPIGAAAASRRHRVVLETESRLHHPDRVGHGEREDSRLRRGEHVHAGCQAGLRISLLHIVLNRAVAETEGELLELRSICPS